MKLSIWVISVLLAGLIETKSAHGKFKLTADFVLNSPDYQDASPGDLPKSFWSRVSRHDLVKLTQKFGLLELAKFLKVVNENKLDLMISKDQDWILFTDVSRNMKGEPVFSTNLDSYFTDEFQLKDIDSDLFQTFRPQFLARLRLAPTLAQLNHETIYKVTRFYFPNLEKFIEPTKSRQEILGMILEQSLCNLLTQLLKNEKAPMDRFQALEKEKLIEQIIHHHGTSGLDGVIEWCLKNPFDPNGVISFVLDKLVHHKFTQLKATSPREALHFLLTVFNFAEVASGKIPITPELLDQLLQEHGLRILGEAEWSIIAAQAQPKAIESVVIVGLIIGNLKLKDLADQEYFASIVRRLDNGQLWVGEGMAAKIAKPLALINASYRAVSVPSRVLRMLIADEAAAHLSQESLLKHLLFNEERGLLLGWFWKLFGEGKACFPVATEAFKDWVIGEDVEVGFLAFPERFELRPPPSFSKQTLLELISFGPVNGTIRKVNAIVSKLIKMKFDALTWDELAQINEFARDSNLSYKLGIQLYQALRQDEEPLIFKKAPLENLKSIWPRLEDGGQADLDTFRSMFTWVPAELDAQVMQQFQILANTLEAHDIAFILGTTPYRSGVQTILKFRYGLIKGKQIPDDDLLTMEDIIQDYKDDVLWLVNLSLRLWDPSDLAIIKEAFLATHGFSEEVWHNVRFIPLPSVRAYLELVAKYDNVPLGFIEHLRLERGMSIDEVDKYIEQNVTHPSL